jgi:methyl-accepting chemotaxis protein
MKLSVRAKIVFMTVAILCFAIGANTLISSYIFTKEYSSALRSETFIIGQGLKLQLDKLLSLGISVEELTGFEKQCQEIVAKYKEISYAMVIDSKGKILFHNDPSQQGKVLVSAPTDNALKSARDIIQVYSTEGEQYYDITIPALDPAGEQVAAVKIGFPVKFIAQKTQKLIVYSTVIAVISIVLATIILVVVFSIWVTKPVGYLSRYAVQLADGSMEYDLQEITSHDEIGTLFKAFKQLTMYFQEMAHVATEISRGNLGINVRRRSKKDVFGDRFEQMITYLEKMGKVATHVAQGDLRSQITLQSQTDQLGTAFIHMQEGLIALVSEIHAVSNYITSASAKILNASAKNSEALEQIGNAAEVTSSAMGEVNATAEDVRVNMEQLTATVEKNGAAISQMIASINQVAENTRNLSHFADNTTTTVVQIVDSLEKVAKQAERSREFSETTSHDVVSGQQSVEQVIASITTISKVTKNISNLVSRLESRSVAIGSILDVINEVAEQTSLLALNASIIAAQAGVHGRGFAVVADEIKELATRVGTSTKEIATIVKAVQGDSSNAVNAIEQGLREVEHGVAVAHQAGEALHKIGESAGNSSEVAAEMAMSVRQQTKAHLQITESIKDVTKMINEITRSTQEQEKNSDQLFKVVENMQMLSVQVLRAIQEQQQSTQQVTHFMENVTNLVEENTQTVQQLAESANELATQADILKQKVERFVIPS